MNFLEKKRQLQTIIKTRLTPLIDSNFVLYGLPYYKNIGDTLIWNGELEFFKTLRFKCVGVCPWDKYPNERLDSNINVLITGGGYFGDVWRNGWEYALNGIKCLKKNKIIIMPSSIHYDSDELLKEDAAYLSSFPNLEFCVRDNDSYEKALKYFSNPVHLVPDMAYYMNERTLLKHNRQTPTKNALYFKRNDKEFVESNCQIPEKLYDTSDWITMEKVLPDEEEFYKYLWRVQALAKYSVKISKWLETQLYKTKYRSFLTQNGLKQLAPYEKIYTTRLHAMILGMLLGREVRYIDNSYGKLSTYYNTWLQDCDNVKPL